MFETALLHLVIMAYYIAVDYDLFSRELNRLLGLMIYSPPIRSCFCSSSYYLISICSLPNNIIIDSLETLKHLYCGLCGFFLAVFCYGNDCIHSLLSILITYTVLWVFSKHRTLGLAIAFIGNMGHLLGSYWFVSTGNFPIISSFKIDD